MRSTLALHGCVPLMSCSAESGGSTQEILDTSACLVTFLQLLLVHHRPGTASQSSSYFTLEMRRCSGAWYLDCKKHVLALLATEGGHSLGPAAPIADIDTPVAESFGS